MDDRQTVTQNAVLIEAGDVIDRSLDLAPEPVSRREVVAVGVKPRAEKLDQQSRHGRIAGQRLLQVAVTKRCAGLAQIFQERAQQRDFATRSNRLVGPARQASRSRTHRPRPP